MLGRRAIVSVGAMAIALGTMCLWKARPTAREAPVPPVVRASIEPPSPDATQAVPPPEPAKPAADPSEEQHLRELERLSQSNPAAALALALREDAVRAREGVFAEARRALIVTLLVDLGRMSDAREITRDFLQRYPTSRYLELVKGVTGIHPRPSPREMAFGR